MPWTPEDAKRHTAKAKSLTAQRQWAHVADSALKRGLPEGTAIREANGVVAKRYAPGGAVSPLEAAISSGAPYLGRSAGMRNPGIPMAHARMRMPYVPIADSMRNIDKSIIKSKNTLGKMKSSMKPPKAVTAGVRTKFAGGGMVDPEAANAVQGALDHIKGGDFGAASATLRNSKNAMRHPAVARAAEHLRDADGLSPAAQELQRFMKFMGTGQVTGEEGG
jgi:hypothetical protein